MLHEEGKYNTRRSEKEEALCIFNKALRLCENVESFPNPFHYANLVYAKLGFTNRCLGRYEMAKFHLQEALKEPKLNWCRLKSSGELGTIYSAMNQLYEAKVAFEMQYKIAQQLDNNTICQAIGNLGMINYQLSQQDSDPELLELAVTQLKERVDRERQISDILKQGNMEAKEKAARLKQAAVWISIGLNCLSLCYTAQRKTKEAIETAKESQSI
jgi:tetratricopeptide (TPR) repeat protein